MLLKISLTEQRNLSETEQKGNWSDDEPAKKKKKYEEGLTVSYWDKSFFRDNFLDFITSFQPRKDQVDTRQNLILHQNKVY